MKHYFRKTLKITAVLALSIIVLTGLKKIYDEATGNFSIANIRYEETAFRPKTFDVETTPEKIKLVKTILNQEYSFLGKGNQSYAFLSADSKYVLKFFKFGHWKENCPATKERFFKVFEGYHVAYTEDPENSALVFIHLNKTNNLQQSVTVKDRLGIPHSVDLDSVVFIIQEKVTPTRDVLTELFTKGNTEGVKTRIRQLFSLYLTQYKKGLYDRDHNLVYNTGFKDDRAIRLDVGKFRREPAIKEFEAYKKDLEKIAFVRLNRFVKTYYPKYETEIANFMRRELDTIFNE